MTFRNWIQQAVTASKPYVNAVFEIVAAGTWNGPDDLGDVFAALPNADMTELQRQFLLAGRLAGMESMHGHLRTRQLTQRWMDDFTAKLAAHAESIAFDSLPFIEAIEAFRTRLGLNPDEFLTLDAQARSRAFRVAGIYNMKLLSDIHSELLLSMENGETQRDFRLRLPELAERRGWTGENPWHANVVHFQNVAMASNAGRYEQMQRAGVGHWQFVVNGDTCPICLPQMNKVFALDDRKYYPPLHFNCDCEPEPMFDGEFDAGDVTRAEAVDNPALTKYQQADSAFTWDPAHYAKLEPLSLDGFPPALQPAFKEFAAKQGWEISNMNTNRPSSHREETSDQCVVAFDVLSAVAPPREIMIFPAGIVESKKGTFTIDQAAADDIIAAFAAHGVDLPIDAEHQSLGGEFAAPGGLAPALGYIKALRFDPAVGMFAQVDWTAHGAELVSSRAYRYLSPVLLVRKSDDRPAALHSVAMTNKPAIVGMKPIVNKETAAMSAENTKESEMTYEQLLAQMREMAGVAANADHPTTVAALKAKVEGYTALRTAVCSASNKPAATADTELIALCAKLTPDSDVTVIALKQSVTQLGEQLTAAQSELKTLREKTQASDGEKLIAAALSEGKLNQKMIERDAKGYNFWREMACSEPAKFTSVIAAQPVIAPPSGRVVGNSTGVAGGDTGARDRATIIATARRGFADEKQSTRAVLCSEASWVNEALRIEKMKPLNEDEAKQLAV